MMKKQFIIPALILTAAVSVTGVVGISQAMTAGSQPKGSVQAATGAITEEGSQTEIDAQAEAEARAEAARLKELAEKYPLEAIRQHAAEAAKEMDLPDDRLYGIITYGGEDHLMVADEHKEEDHYGVEYIHTLIDTDGVDWYEPEPVNMYFECPVCKSHCSDYIRVGDRSPGRIFWCECDKPWVIGLTIAEEEVREKMN